MGTTEFNRIPSARSVGYRRPSVLCAVGFGVLAGVLLSGICQAQIPESTLATFRRDVQPVLTETCVKCHGPERQEGEVRLDTLDPSLQSDGAIETWHDALNRLTLGEMPPPKAAQPTAEQRGRLTEWIQRAIREASEARRYAEGRVVTRRLTRYEYQNTMRDLLGVELDFTRDLPPDPPSADGFTNDGATLEMSPLQLEAYLESARRGLGEAIVEGEAPEVHRMSADKTAVGKLPNRKVAGHVPANPEFLVDLDPFPRKGEFQIRIRAGAHVPPGHDYPRMQLWLGCIPGIVHVPRKLVGEVDVTAPADEPQEFVFRGRIENYPQPGDVPFGNVDFDGMVGLIEFLDADGNELRYPDRTYAVPPEKRKKRKRADVTKPIPPPDGIVVPEPAPRLDIVIQSVEFEAPVFDHWPPSSHARILPEPVNKDGGEGELTYVRQVLERFMSRAFRRPARSSEVEATLELFQSLRKVSPSFEEAIRETLASVLISPHFLYRVESRAEEAREPEPVTQFELATRLSYFLWSTTPDENLLEHARSQTLEDPEVFEAEVERMLTDPRSERFLRRFADQWFDLQALDRVAVNPEYFPDFDNGLKEDMAEETRRYLAEILRSDRSCLELLDSNWSMLNRSLAKHYGVAGPRSSQFERVVFDDPDQTPALGGVLSQGAFLLSNSNGESPHPIKRAVWILDRLLDDPPSPPPPDVPELDPTRQDLSSLSLKEQLAAHRQKDSCASCHRGIDPWGIPLENFNAVGQWKADETLARETARDPESTKPGAKELDKSDSPADATTLGSAAVSSILPDGTQITGSTEFKRYLRERRARQFSESLVRRLLSYALGRSLDAGDRAAVDQLTDRFADGGYRLAPLIIDIAKSGPFQTK